VASATGRAQRRPPRRRSSPGPGGSHESGTIPAAGARRTVWHRDVHARPEVPCSESSRVRVFKMEKMPEDVQVTSRCSLVARDKAPKLHAGAGQGGPRPVGPSQ
jgi:hypothetical protein